MSRDLVKFSCPRFAVRPNQTTEEGAVGGEKDPSTSQEESKKCMIMYTPAFM